MAPPIRSLLLAMLLATSPCAVAPVAAAAPAHVPPSAVDLAASGAADALRTEAESSGFRRTGRYAEVVALCDAFAARHPDAVRCEDFGTSPEGRPMKLLVVSRTGALDAATARARGLPVVLVQGGIHAGEIDGKDAGFLALRQVLAGEAAPGVLDRLVWLFVPVFNVDGHERFGAWNRPNQRGPEQMGWRTTAQNLNLNRDYAKADAPEMQAMLRLVQAWDPLAVVDLHVTNGAQFEHDISITVEPVHAGDAELQAVGKSWRDGVIDDLARAGHLPLAFYPSFVEYDVPTSGFADGVATPRFSTGYFWLRNRLAMLVETHSWRHYPERVASTRNALVSAIERIAANGPAWRQIAHAADARAAALAGLPVPLAFEADAVARTIPFRGYAYTRTPSTVSGAMMTRYDESTPQLWNIPLRDRIVPTLTVDAPRAGYLVPPAHAQRVAARLAQHGIGFRRLEADHPALPVRAFRADTVTPGTQTVEGRPVFTVIGEWQPETHAIGAGALFVPIAQPGARLLMSLLEPRAPDSLLAWGEFANMFELKEYMEPYVAEAVAREMLAADPALKAAFEAKLRDNPEFAASQAKRLEFFHRRHPSWDDRYLLYPVLRTDVAPD